MDPTNSRNELPERPPAAFVIRPLPEAPASPAHWMCQGLQQHFDDFSAALRPGESVGLRLVTPVSDTTIELSEIGCYGEDIITFRGLDRGAPVLFVQHVSQLNAAFVKLGSTRLPPAH